MKKSVRIIPGPALHHENTKGMTQPVLLGKFRSYLQWRERLENISLEGGSKCAGKTTMGADASPGLEGIRVLGRGVRVPREGSRAPA